MATLYYDRRLDSFADEIITKVRRGQNGMFYATLDTGPPEPWNLSAPDFAPDGCRETMEEAIRDCARAIRADDRGVGKFAPHACFRGYTFRFQLAKYWAEKETGKQ